jgi:hypothetical protein
MNVLYVVNTIFKNLLEEVISLISEWHFVKNFFFKIGLETNFE